MMPTMEELIAENLRKKRVIEDLLKVRREQHLNPYSPGYYQRLNEAWDNAEAECGMT
jgi:hypothetical protein